MASTTPLALRARVDLRLRLAAPPGGETSAQSSPVLAMGTSSSTPRSTSRAALRQSPSTSPAARRLPLGEVGAAAAAQAELLHHLRRLDRRGRARATRPRSRSPRRRRSRSRRERSGGSRFRFRNSSTTAAWALRSSPSNRGVQTSVPATSARSSPARGSSGGGELHLQGLDLALAGLELVAQARVLVDQLAPVHPRRLLELLEDPLVGLGPRDRRLAGEGLDASRARPRSPARRQQEEADLAGLARRASLRRTPSRSPGTSTTRTRSPYLSPKKASAP